MTEKSYTTPLGIITYWTNAPVQDAPALVFLPGLTADRHLFDRQVEALRGEFNLLVWDAPGHAASRPFELSFSLEDEARWLHDILLRESIAKPVIIGQSNGAYIAQAYLQLYPEDASALVSIDSAPLKRKYYSSAVLWMLRHTESMYRMYPWKALAHYGSRGCSETGYGRALMKDTILSYTKEEYCSLVSYGYRLLAEAIEKDLPYDIPCPALLICGEKDKAGVTRRYNRLWSDREGLPIRWLPGAGHNSNTDCPEITNSLIREFVRGGASMTRSGNDFWR